MRPFRNLWMLEEIGSDYEHINCKPWSKKAKSVHPLGKVPALQVESQCNGINQQFVVLESGAINTFLGDLAREIECCKQSTQQDDAMTANLMLVPPPATQLRAKYDSLVLFIMTELDSQALWIHRKHNDLKDVFGEAPIAVAEAKRQFDNGLKAMEHEINDGSGYLLPSGFCAADILLSNCCFWAQQIGWLARSSLDDSSSTDDAGMTPLTTKLEAYLALCRHREAFKKANALRKDQVGEQKEHDLSKL